MPSSKAFVCGCAGLALTSDERDFMRRERPWGLILFRRNIEEPSKIASLISDFRACVGRAEAPVLIDQEGGRVQRMGPPLWPAYPSAATLGGLSAGPRVQEEAVRLASRLIAADLQSLGVTIDCMPVLDAPTEDGHAVIGDRAYSRDPARIAALGAAAIEGLLAGGVLPVIKHVPGHGRARADSHLELPVVRASARELAATDFAPFAALAEAPLAMTAHVVYEAIDPERPATLSPKVIQDCVRGAIGFRGLLLTDDLSMKALAGPFGARAAAALAAGVDVLLHCNGRLEEASAVADACPLLDGESLARAERALDLIAAGPSPFDAVDARARLQSLLAS
jgi:beta-N-acetylhexosaminidase